ncbi:MAG: hypothetical protein V2A78_06340 [bacterium]
MEKKFWALIALMLVALLLTCAPAVLAQEQVESPPVTPAGTEQTAEPAASSPASGKQKVAVLNFDINSSDKLDYLSDSIPQMILPVLTASNRIEVVSQIKVMEAMDKLNLSSEAEINDKNSIEIGKAAEAKYIVAGSLTTIQSEISLDARILEVETGELQKAIKLRSKGLDSIMELVDLLGKNIVAWFEGRESETRVSHRSTGELCITLFSGAQELDEGKFKVFLNNKHVGDSLQSKKDKKEVRKGKIEDEYNYSYSVPVDVGVYNVKIVWKTKARGMFGKSKESSKQWDNIEIVEGRVQKLEHTI